MFNNIFNHIVSVITAGAAGWTGHTWVLKLRYLRRYFKNQMPFEVFTAIKDSPVVPTLTEVVSPCFLCYSQLMHTPESWWKQRSSGQDQRHSLEAVLLAGRFPLHMNCCEIIQQLSQTFKIRSTIHKIENLQCIIRNEDVHVLPVGIFLSQCSLVMKWHWLILHWDW